MNSSDSVKLRHEKYLLILRNAILPKKYISDTGMDFHLQALAWSAYQQ
jgi:hypothetical protein